MKKIGLICLAGCIVVFVVFFLYLFKASFFGMKYLPEGEFMLSSESPKGTYRIDAYLNLGNATTDFAVRCAVVEIASGEERNIYWQYHQEEADIEWIDDVTVVINGITLNVLEDYYDFREHQ